MLWETENFSEIDRMRRDMRSLLGFMEGNGDYRFAFPRLNVYENRDDYALALELPGMAKDKVDVRFGDNAVTVTGERAAAPAAGHARFLRRERDAGRFEKVYRFPAKVNAASVQASMENGILLVRVPKAEEARPRQITIQG